MKEIESQLKTRWLGRKYTYLEEVDSTNLFCYRLAEKKEPMGSVVLAEKQTAGRGRKGNAWESPRGGLWFSLILRPSFSPMDAAALSIVTAVGLCRGLLYYPGLGARIKWPNDLMVDDKKICGILSEMKVEKDKVQYVVIGIGLNLSTAELSAEIAESAVGIEDILGESIDKKELLCRLLLGLESAYDQYFAGNKAEIFAEWQEQAMYIGEPVTVTTVSGELKGKPVGLSEEGFLLLDIGNGKGAKVISGTLRPDDI